MQCSPCHTLQIPCINPPCGASAESSSTTEPFRAACATLAASILADTGLRGFFLSKFIVQPGHFLLRLLSAMTDCLWNWMTMARQSQASKRKRSSSGYTTPSVNSRFAIMRSGSTAISMEGRTITWRHFLNTWLTRSQREEYSMICGRVAALRWLKSRLAERGICLVTPSRNYPTLTTIDYEAISSPSFEPAQRLLRSGLPSFRFWSIIIARRELHGCLQSAAILKGRSGQREAFFRSPPG